MHVCVPSVVGPLSCADRIWTNSISSALMNLPTRPPQPPEDSYGPSAGAHLPMESHESDWSYPTLCGSRPQRVQCGPAGM